MSFAGSRSLQCNREGKCQCKPGVTGEKCHECALNYFQFSNQGCKPCQCNEAGSRNNMAYCDSNTGVCQCKQNVEGKQCRQYAFLQYTYIDILPDGEYINKRD